MHPPIFPCPTLSAHTEPISKGHRWIGHHIGVHTGTCGGSTQTDLVGCHPQWAASCQYLQEKETMVIIPSSHDFQINYSPDMASLYVLLGHWLMETREC